MDNQNTMLFPAKLEKIGFSILEDDLTIFKKEYKRNIVIDENKRLLSFCMESIAYSIVNYIIHEKSKEYIKLTHEEKVTFFIDLFRRTYSKKQKDFAFNTVKYICENYKVSKELIQSIMLNSLKYGLFNIYKLMSKTNELGNKEIKSLLNYVKINETSLIKIDLYKKILLKILSKNRKSNNKLYFYFNLLTLNIGGIKNQEDISLEINTFKSLPEVLKVKWIDYLFNKNNLKFYTFNVTDNPVKNEKINPKSELNLDFLHFLIESILKFKSTLSEYELKQLILLKKDLMTNDFYNILVYNRVFTDFESIIQKNLLEKNLIKKEIPQKRKIIKI